MQPDLSAVTFNPNHKKESRGLQALSGLRLMLVSFVVYSIAIALAITAGLWPQGALATSGLSTAAIWLLSLAGFGFGAYGTYLVVDSLGWAKYISFIIIASFLLPYVRMISLLVVAVMAIDLVSKSGLRLSLFGKPVRVAALLVLSLLATPAFAQDGPPPLTPEQSTAAAGRYQQYCALCHGPDRAGYANDHAPSLKSPQLFAAGYPYIIGEAIAYGRPGTPMGGYSDEVAGPLSRTQIRELTMWLGEQAAAAPLDLPDGAIAGDVKLGAQVYADNCASCHGAQGEGGTGTALGNATMLALTPDAFLRHTIENGRDGTPMVAFRDKLSPAQLDGVTAFIRSRSAGWTAPDPVRHAPPALGAYVLNPDAAAPEFALKDGLYVSAAELDRELKARKRLVLLDTRVTSMWERAHIEGAVPGPYYASREEVMANLPTDGTWIVAYCECPRAAAESVVRKLREGGFRNTAVLWEGIQGWVSLGYPVVPGNATRTVAGKP